MTESMVQLEQLVRGLEASVFHLRQQLDRAEARIRNLETRNNMPHPAYSIEATAALDAICATPAVEDVRKTVGAIAAIERQEPVTEPKARGYEFL